MRVDVQDKRYRKLVDWLANEHSVLVAALGHSFIGPDAAGVAVRRRCYAGRLGRFSPEISNWRK